MATQIGDFGEGTMSGSTNRLGAGFAPRGVADWREKVTQDLKGADPERLRSKTEDGIPVEPLYTSGEFLQVPPRQSDAVERVSRVGAEANGRIAEAIAHELGHGASGVLLELSTPGHSDGLDAEPADWDAVLEALPKGGALHLRAHSSQLAHARAWLESSALKSHASVSLGLDPFRTAALTGTFDDLEGAVSGAARLAAEAIDHPAHPRSFDLDSGPYSGAGATTVQAVGSLLAALVQVLRSLEGASVDPARGCSSIGLTLRLDPRFFEQIAALRALRLLHAQVVRACGIEDPPELHLTALPSERMLSRRDPWVNMLRETATSFAALVGGADAVGAVAFDARLETTSDLGRRIARNTPTILDEESHLTRVADPASGSWFLDQLTRDIAGAAWSFFQEIEAEGGLVATMKSGWLLEQFSVRQEERAARLASRKQPRTGVTEYANVAERLPAPVGTMVVPTGKAWPRHGFDDAFERLRAAADRHAIAHPRPRVFLARSGNPAGYSARESWLVNLAAAAGIEAVLGDPEGDVANEFVASGAATAVLTADDETLATQGPRLASDLGKFGTVWAAGKPVDALADAGIARFVHIGIDVVEALGELLADQGVQR